VIKNKLEIVMLCFIFICPIKPMFVHSETKSHPLIENNHGHRLLNKSGEIKDGFCDNESNFFIKITGLCTDFDNNLYVADSGWNKIFKFDPNGRFMKSFGSGGQGPGEFLGNTYNCFLHISHGNNGNIYVLDQCNRQLSVFSADGVLENKFRLYENRFDTAAVNSEGDIYMLSKSGIKLIDCYDRNLKFKGYLLDFDSHISFPFGKPFSRDYFRFHEFLYPIKFELTKLMTRKDNLVLVSNYSLNVIVFNNNVKMNEFRIGNEFFIKDFKKQIEKNLISHADVYSSKKHLSRVLLPFQSFIDQHDDLCLIYKTSEGYLNILKYNLNGTFLDRFSISERFSYRHVCVDNRGYIYLSRDDARKIYIFKF
jgi:hypothetical protein